MSLCLCAFHKNFIAIAADSRGSYYIEGEEKLATTDDVQKIFQVGNKVIFISGFAELLHSIVKLFEKSHVQTIDELSKIASKQYEIWKIVNPELSCVENGRAAELIIATVENGQCIIYSISSYEDNFKPRRYEGQNHFSSCTLGSFAPESLKDLRYKLNNEISRYASKNIVDLPKMFLDIYSKYPCETMGGHMKFYFVAPNGIFPKESVRIPDTREIKRINLASQHCSVDYGIQIDQNLGTPENPVWDNVVYFNNYGHLIIDGGWIKLLTQDGKNEIYLDPEKGFQISKNGVKTVYIDTDGNVIFGGKVIGGSIESSSTIDITTDATIGQRLYMQTSNFDDGIYFSTFAPQTSITVDPGGTIIITPNITTENIYCSDISISNGASGSFGTPDGKTVIVSDGIITGIY
jgi:hypothetical protein